MSEPIHRKVTHKRLLELLHYDPATGVFTWRVSRCRRTRARAGDRAGYEHRARLTPWRGITIELKHYRASRLAWFYMTGVWPKKEINHRNGNSLDDAWANLRLATSTQNKASQKKRRDNKSGFKGVHPCGSRFYARTRIDGVYRHLGMFATAEKASETYRRVTTAVHGEFARHD